MNILFSEIPEEGLTIEVRDPGWFPDLYFDRINEAYASLFFEKKGGVRVLLTGKLSVDLNFPCDRCLLEYIHPLYSEFQVDFELLRRGEQDHQEKEHACSEAEMDVVYLDRAKIDVFAILEQQLYIATSGKKLCSEKCRGLCPGCGVNLNTDPCGCVEDITKSPFGVLARLKK